MKREDAITQLAQMLKEQHDAAIAAATQRLGSHGEITVKELDFTLEATRVLEENVIEAAYYRAVENLSGYGRQAVAQDWNSAPPPPAAPCIPRAR